VICILAHFSFIHFNIQCYVKFLNKVNVPVEHLSTKIVLNNTIYNILEGFFNINICIHLKTLLSKEKLFEPTYNNY